MNPVIQEAATKYGIDPKILLGVYGTETDFGRDVKPSSAGALGPFQLEPSTAQSLGVKDPNNFREAAFGAARYLAQYKSRGIGGMLSAYNAGPAGGYQAGYVATTLKNAGYSGPIAEPVASSRSQGVGQVRLPSTTVVNPQAKGLEMLASEYRYSDPVLAGVLERRAEPTQSGGGTISVPGVGESPSNPGPSPNLKTVPPPVKVTLPAYITGAKKAEAVVGKAEAALGYAKGGTAAPPVGKGALEGALRSAGTQKVFNAYQGNEDTGASHRVIAQAPQGKVVKTLGGVPLYVPEKKR